MNNELKRHSFRRILQKRAVSHRVLSDESPAKVSGSKLEMLFEYRYLEVSTVIVLLNQGPTRILQKIQLGYSQVF